jgi:hypothetical protein
MDVLDTVLLHLRIEDGKFLADLGQDTVEIDHLRRDGDGNVWATYWQDGTEVTVCKYQAYKFRSDFSTDERLYGEVIA